MPSLKPLLRLGASLSILALAGCSTLTSAPLPAQPKTKVVVGSFAPIAASPADTCATQMAIAKHNAIYDSIRSGRAVKYTAPCEAAPAEGKTS